MTFTKSEGKSLRIEEYNSPTEPGKITYEMVEPCNYIPQYTSGRDVTDDTTYELHVVPLKDLGNGLYEVTDLDQGIAQGKIEFTPDEKGVRAKKIGTWESLLPNGHTVITEFNGPEGDILFSPLDNGKFWMQPEVNHQITLDENGKVVKGRELQMLIIEDFAEEKAVITKGVVGRVKQFVKDLFGKPTL